MTLIREWSPHLSMVSYWLIENKLLTSWLGEKCIVRRGLGWLQKHSRACGRVARKDLSGRTQRRVTVRPATPDLLPKRQSFSPWISLFAPITQLLPKPGKCLTLFTILSSPDSIQQNIGWLRGQSSRVSQALARSFMRKVRVLFDYSG